MPEGARGLWTAGWESGSGGKARSSHFKQASTCDVRGEQLYQKSSGIYTGHFMQI